MPLYLTINRKDFEERIRVVFQMEANERVSIKNFRMERYYL